MPPGGRPEASVHAGRVRRLVARLRADGVLSLQVAKTAVATALGYQVGEVTRSPYPVFAALAALLVVQVTVYDSVTRGLQRIGGVVVGVLVAFGAARAFGLHAWTIGVVVLLAIAAGRALRLGEGGAVQVPVSALLVVTVGSTSRYAVDRIVESVLGAAVGIAVNLVLAPPTRTRDAGRSVRDLARAQAGVLAAAGAGLPGQRWTGEAAGWLDAARRLDPLLRAAREAVERGQTSLRLNPRGTRLAPAAERRRVALRALEHVTVQVRGVARTLLDVAEDREIGASGRPTPQPARAALGRAMASVALALEAYGEVAAEPAAHETSEEAVRLRGSLEVARHEVEGAVSAARSLPTWAEGTWLATGSILTDLDRLLGELDGRAQAELLQARLEPRLRRLPLPGLPLLGLPRLARPGVPEGGPSAAGERPGANPGGGSALPGGGRAQPG